jgi:chemotaxis protein methyltransferase CheR
MIPGTEPDWKLLTDLLEERFGLCFTGARQDILAGRLVPRLEQLKLDDVRAYYHFLSAHPSREEEFGELSRRLTNNETYFFREVAHFEVIAHQVLPEFSQTARPRPFRILSAACSSGEEPYSLAIRLTDAGLELNGLPWAIEACDLNPLRLEQARRAVYEGSSFRACDDATRARCFDDIGDGRFQLKERYRRRVRFFQANLAAPFSGAGWGHYDIVLCRNLLIYFGPEAFDRLISRVAQLLTPGGYLFLGHSESLYDRSTDFESVHFASTMAYRRLPEDS